MGASRQENCARIPRRPTAEQTFPPAQACNRLSPCRDTGARPIAFERSSQLGIRWIDTGEDDGAPLDERPRAAPPVQYSLVPLTSMPPVLVDRRSRRTGSKSRKPNVEGASQSVGC